jgi:hypothetical protein
MRQRTRPHQVNESWDKRGGLRDMVVAVGRAGKIKQGQMERGLPSKGIPELFVPVSLEHAQDFLS